MNQSNHETNKSDVQHKTEKERKTKDKQIDNRQKHRYLIYRQIFS